MTPYLLQAIILHTALGCFWPSKDDGGRLDGGCWALPGWRARPACLHWPTFSIPHVFVHFSSLTSGDPPRYRKLYSHQEHRWIRKENWGSIGVWLFFTAHLERCAGWGVRGSWFLASSSLSLWSHRAELICCSVSHQPEGYNTDPPVQHLRGTRRHTERKSVMSC